MPTTPPTITAAPAAPQRGVKATFSTLLDAFVTWLTNSVAQFNAVATNAYNNATEAFNSAGTALNHANTAAAAADSAVAVTSAVQWVSGTTYAKGAAVWSPVDVRTYRRLVAGAGTSDPSADPANWQLLTKGPDPVFHVRGVPASEVTQQDLNTRVLNTVATNSITGASLASNRVTLPAGTYDIRAIAPLGAADYQHQAWLQNITDATTALTGIAQTNRAPSHIIGRIVLAAAKVFEVQHFVANGTANLSMHPVSGSGKTLPATELFITKVA